MQLPRLALRGLLAAGVALALVPAPAGAHQAGGRKQCIAS